MALKKDFVLVLKAVAELAQHNATQVVGSVESAFSEQ